MRFRGTLISVLTCVLAFLSLCWYSNLRYVPQDNPTRQITSDHAQVEEVSNSEHSCLCDSHDSSKIKTSFETTEFPSEECCRPSVGNGFLATVVYSDTVHMNGLYNGYGGNSHRARIPSTASIAYHLPRNVSEKSQNFTLDVKKGVFIRFTQLNNVNITQRIYAHQYYNRLIVNDITIARNPGLVKDDFVVTLSLNTGSVSSDINFKNGSSNWTDVGYMFGNTIQAETNTSGAQPVHVYWTLVPSQLTLPSTETTHTWTYITSVSNSSSEARAFYDVGKKELSTLFQKHQDLWLDKWNQGCIDVDGDMDLVKAIYGSLYYILSSLPPLVYSKQPNSNFQFYGLSPGSLANGDNSVDSYQGHVFWDQETWMYPPILIFHPELAKMVLGTRLMHMGEAAQMAKDNGYDGLKFPWEMAYSGFEVCPAPPYSTNEIHINGDIALAIQQYLQLTGDTSFLTKEGGIELIEGLAKFWASKADYDSSTDTYSIRDVMGPDEYHKRVNNSVYTNTVAKISLRLPSFAARLMKTAPSDPSWQKIADKLVVPFNKEKNYHPEFEGYIFGNRIKQADVILLGYPLMVNMSSTVRVNDLQYYDTIDGYHVTDVNGPAMTWSMYVIGWLELGNESMAAAQLMKSLLNLQQPFKIWTEEATGYGAVNFITGMGGFLQSIIYGYGGLRIRPDSLTFNVTLPPTSTQFNITGIYFLGNKLNIRAIRSSLHINKTASEPNAVELEVVIGGELYPLKTGQPVITQRAPGKIRKTLRMQTDTKIMNSKQRKIRLGKEQQLPDYKRRRNVLKFTQLRKSKIRQFK